jgi:hypothetical protein
MNEWLSTIKRAAGLVGELSWDARQDLFRPLWLERDGKLWMVRLQLDDGARQVLGVELIPMPVSARRSMAELLLGEAAPPREVCKRLIRMHQALEHGTPAEELAIKALAELTLVTQAYRYEYATSSWIPGLADRLRPIATIAKGLAPTVAPSPMREALGAAVANRAKPNELMAICLAHLPPEWLKAPVDERRRHARRLLAVSRQLGASVPRLRREVARTLNLSMRQLPMVDPKRGY